MTTILNLLQAIAEHDIELQSYRTYNGSVRLFFIKRTGDIVTKIGHEFSQIDLTERIDPAVGIGAVVQFCINEVVENHSATLKII